MLVGRKRTVDDAGFDFVEVKTKEPRRWTVEDPEFTSDWMRDDVVTRDFMAVLEKHLATQAPREETPKNDHDTNLTVSARQEEVPCAREDKKPSDESSNEEFFTKVLTRSDVKNLCRCLIHKESARTFFPKLSNPGEVDPKAEASIEMEFIDSNGKVWPMRYKFWLSNSGYHLGKGWLDYVKENKLEEGDVIIIKHVEDKFYISHAHKSNRE